jgi:hypothetical protein
LKEDDKKKRERKKGRKGTEKSSLLKRDRPT